MGQKEKLIEQLKNRPKTFTFHDAEVLLDYLEFTKSNKGKTSGSRVMFISEEHLRFQGRCCEILGQRRQQDHHDCVYSHRYQ